MNQSQEFSPLTIKGNLYFGEYDQILQEQLDQANEKVKQLMQQQQQLSEELEKQNMMYNEQLQKQQSEPQNKLKQTDEDKFVNCILDMISPSDQKMPLKHAWKQLKFVLDDYIDLKKQTQSKNTKSEIFKNGKKDSIVVGDLIKKNYQVIESQYLKHSNCR